MAALWVEIATRVTSSNRLTLHDGSLSVRRAPTPTEMLAAAEMAGMRGATVTRLGPVRMALRWQRSSPAAERLR